MSIIVNIFFKNLKISWNGLTNYLKKRKIWKQNYCLNYQNIDTFEKCYFKIKIRYFRKTDKLIKKLEKIENRTNEFLKEKEVSINLVTNFAKTKISASKPTIFFQKIEFF